MKSEIRFYQAGFADEAPEILDYREEIEVKSKKELIQYALQVGLSESIEYAHIYDGDEPIIAITKNGIRDVEEDTWIVEPEDNEE